MKIPLGTSGGYLLATWEQLRDLERSEVRTTPAGVRYVIAGRFRKTRGHLVQDFLVAYARKHGSERGAWAHIVATAACSGGASISPVEVSKWKTVPKSRYPDGYAADNAIRKAITDDLARNPA